MMGITADKIFVNLPVKDLKQTMDFFSKVGFEFNAQFTDDKAACMIVSDKIFVMLLLEDFFQSFTKKEIPDATKSREVILALSADSREQVDEIVNKALASGAQPANEPIDHGFMYGWSFQDINGHLWEFMWMDESGIAQ